MSEIQNRCVPWHVAIGMLGLATITSDAVAQHATASPTLQYSTYLDGSGGELIRDIISDAAGNVYVTGGTYSTNFPTTPGAYQRTLNPGTTPPGTNAGTFDNMDVFVTKFNPQGQIVWSTLLGGPEYDRAYAIELDNAGNVYVGGRAGPAFPTTAGAIQTNFIKDTIGVTNGYGDQDAFVARISADGSTLDWSTYIGSAGPTLMRDMRVDRNTGVVHAGVNRVSGSFQHITSDALQSTFGNSNDAAYLRLDGSNGSLLYGTLLGGNGDDYRPSIVTDGNGGAYVMIQSDSTNLPAPQGGFKQGPNGGMDFAVYHFDSNNVAVGATHFGGTGNELTETHGLERDANGNIFISGGTTSTNLPTTVGAYQTAINGTRDAFVAKLSDDLSQVLAATYFGGSDGGDDGEGIAIGPDGSIFMAGVATSSDMPTTADALIPLDPGGDRNGALKRFSNDLAELLYASYIGGSGNGDDARIAHVTANFDVYVGGILGSDDFPTLNAYDAVQSGPSSAFLMKFNIVPEPSALGLILAAGPLLARRRRQSVVR